MSSRKELLKLATELEVLAQSLPRPTMQRTAGEVRFIKDKGGEGWAWDQSRHSDTRNIPRGYEFEPDGAKVLIKLLRSTTMALGHALSAYTQLTKAKSREFSPDGMIGGTGYVKKISGIRQEYNNIIEALSSLSDTYYDEITAEHWKASMEEEPEDVRREVDEMLDSVEDIRYAPESFARQQELEDNLFGKKKKE